MSDSQKSLLVLSTDLALSQETAEQLSERLQPIAESLVASLSPEWRFSGRHP